MRWNTSHHRSADRACRLPAARAMALLRLPPSRPRQSLQLPTGATEGRGSSRGLGPIYVRADQAGSRRRGRRPQTPTAPPGQVGRAGVAARRAIDGLRGSGPGRRHLLSAGLRALRAVGARPDQPRRRRGARPRRGAPEHAQGRDRLPRCVAADRRTDRAGVGMGQIAAINLVGRGEPPPSRRRPRSRRW